MEKKIEKLDVHSLTEGISDDWRNFVVANLNDHVVRLSVLRRDFHWHSHSKSDEFFYVVEGRLYVDLEQSAMELSPGEMVLIPKGVRHRTRAKEKTITLCFEHKDNDVTGD